MNILHTAALSAALLVGFATPALSQTLETKSAEPLALELFDPSPRLVRKIVNDARYYGSPDVGLALTGLEDYTIPRAVFGKRPHEISSFDKSLLTTTRKYFTKPKNLEMVWSHSKHLIVPTIIDRVGKSRLNRWGLAPNVLVLQEGNFDPKLGKLYEDWRTNHCQWWLQIEPDPGVTPPLTAAECKEHEFYTSLAMEPGRGDDFVNVAHAYGFLWRRYLEGDMDLVKSWQGILRDVFDATQE